MVATLELSNTSADRHLQVFHPLRALRRDIRAYVILQGAASLALYLLFWFWIGLAFDFGLFKLFEIDLVQELPRDLRVTVLILGGGILVLIAMRLLLRLCRQLRPDSLAMVLERRFPKQLGDRLITAVELSDQAAAQRYGFSRPMLAQTMREAAEQLHKLRVSDVLDWKRLRSAGTRVLLLGIAPYVLAGLTYCVALGRMPGDYASRFNNVAQIWFERNIFLSNTIWPRQAYLMLVDFPPNGDLRVGRNAPAPTLRVRAIKWVVADAKAPEGWRPMLWSDLTSDILGQSPLPNLLPLSWAKWPLDWIELQLEKPGTASILSSADQDALRSLLARLEERASWPWMGRRYRKLQIPDHVMVYYKGNTIRSEQSLKQLTGNEYSGMLTDLQESIRFTVKGEDYWTPYQRITIVPPPSLIELSRDEDRPAYLYQRQPANSTAEALRGLKQRFRDVPISLSGNTSRIDVFAGTNVVLRGRADKELKVPAGIRLLIHAGRPAAPADLRQTDARSFEVRFDNVTATLDFDIELMDNDNVWGKRHLVIKPIDDSPPDVDVCVEIIPKRTQGYFVTTAAQIPLSGKARDDHGLEKLEYAYTISSPQSQIKPALQLAASAFLLSTGCPGTRLTCPGYVSWLQSIMGNIADDSHQPRRLKPLPSFLRRLRENESAPATLADLEKRLVENPDRFKPLLRDYSFDPDEDRFDLDALHLRETDDQQREIQPHYKMHLWIQATDNNVESGPGVSESRERFTFVIVPEDELLIEIAKAEEELRIKVEDTVNRLKEGRGKLDRVAAELPSLARAEFSPMARRIEEVQETLIRGWDVSREVSLDYRNILKELEVNRVNPKIIERVDKNICDPLDAVISQEFVRADGSIREFLKTLEECRADISVSARAREAMDKLVERLSRILDAMADLTTINKLIENLKHIIESERKAATGFREEKDRAAEDILNRVLNQQPPKTQKKKPQ